MVLSSLVTGSHVRPGIAAQNLVETERGLKAALRHDPGHGGGHHDTRGLLTLLYPADRNASFCGLGV